MSQEALELVRTINNGLPMVRRVRTCDILNTMEDKPFVLTTANLDWPILGSYTCLYSTAILLRIKHSFVIYSKTSIYRCVIYIVVKI